MYISFLMPKINSFSNAKERKLFTYINQFPQPSGFSRRLIISEGHVHTEEKIVLEFIKNEKYSTKFIKLGKLNNGFTFFYDHNYSTRLITKKGKVVGIELYINEDDKIEPLELKIPIIYEEKFSKPGSPETLLKAFQTVI